MRVSSLVLIGLVAVGVVAVTRARALPVPSLASRTGRATAIGSASGGLHYAGWAMEAYPGTSFESLKAQMRRQIRSGANVVWLGHNNPGDVGYGKREPGLSYAVWAAYSKPTDPLHDQAVAMVAAQRNALEAARAMGVRVVLPVGYQIQMGQAWNRAHPDELRRASDGTLYDAAGGPNNSASFYAPDYRKDIRAYYRWIDTSFVRPFASTILMLNLADEPEDGDYSSWADQAFRATHGYGLFEAGDNPVRQEAVGSFESRYIASYAAWSARQWLSLEPELPVTMSFCGGYSRYMHEGPNLEDIFREAPRNFVVTFDAYPRDGLYDTPLREGDLIALFGLVRTLGYYSAAYHRPLWLWSAANSWGLNEASADPGRIGDAVANGIYLIQLARQTGGDVRGLAVWNYNVRSQGLYNDVHRLTYDPDRMFARVSASFPLWRDLMAEPAGRPDSVVLAPDSSVLRLAGSLRSLRAVDSYRWDALGALARGNVPAVTLTHLNGFRLPALRTVLVLARRRNDLTVHDQLALRDLLNRGGTIVANAEVADDLVSAQGGQLLARDDTRGISVRRLPSRKGTLLAVDGAPVEEVFADGNGDWAGSIWLQALHRSAPSASYVVSLGGVTLLYSIARGGASASVETSANHDLTVFDADGVAVRSIHQRQGVALRVFVPRRGYALVIDRGRRT